MLNGFDKSRYLEFFITIVVAIPIFGLLFPWETYVSMPSLANPIGVPTEPTRASMAVLTFLATAIVVLYARSPRACSAVFANWPLFLYIGWAFVTALWSEQPAQTVNRTGRVLIYSLFAIYMVENLKNEYLIRILVRAILIGLVVSAIMTLIYPGLTRSVDYRVTWRGGYVHKNGLGALTAGGLLIGMFGSVRQAVGRTVHWLLLGGCAIAALATNSVTPLVALFIAVCLTAYLANFAMGQPLDRVAALIALLLGGAVLGSLSLVLADSLALVGRDATLTGRTAVWAFAERMIDARPFLGWGHGAWSGPVFSKYVLDVLQWPSTHAHNTWLDMRLQLGVPGLFIGITMIMICVLRSVKLIFSMQNRNHLLWIGLLIYYLIIGTVESLFIEPANSSIFWLALISASLSRLCRELPSRHSRTVPGRTLIRTVRG